MTNSFGKRIQERRENIKLSRKELAVKINTTQSYIWELENDKIKQPSAQIIVDIAKVLQVNPEFLIPPSSPQSSNTENTDRMFFRKYQGLTDKEKKKLGRILEAIDEDETD